MRILVIGKEGQVARALSERASAHGADRHAGGPSAARSRRSFRASATCWPRSSGDVIVNAAAYTAVDQAEAEPELADAINGIGAGAAAGAAAAMNIPFVQISTDYVFDGSRRPCPIGRTTPCRRLGAYGRSKLLGEQAVAAATANHAILRTSWIYSPFGKNFVKTMLRLARDRDEISVVADQFGGPTSAHRHRGRHLRRLPEPAAQDPPTAPPRRFPHERHRYGKLGGIRRRDFCASAKLGGPSARVLPIPTTRISDPGATACQFAARLREDRRHARGDPPRLARVLAALYRAAACGKDCLTWSRRKSFPLL